MLSNHICASKLLDGALLVITFFYMKALAVAQHHWYPACCLSHGNHKTCCLL